MKPLYISATRQDTGKTATTIGLLEVLRELGHNVGYMKPVGQHYVQYGGENVDEDVALIDKAFELSDRPGDMNPVTVPRGFTREYIFHRDPAPLERRITDAFGRVRDTHDIVLVEGTGHAGVGACLDLSNARVAELLGAGAVIITDGGIGKAIDEVALSVTFFEKHGVEVLGVILNKVWPDPFTDHEEKLLRRFRAAVRGEHGGLDGLLDRAVSVGRRQSQQDRYQKRLAAGLPGIPVIEIPYLFHDRIGPEQLDVLSYHMGKEPHA